MDINKILSEAPSRISFYSEKETIEYEKMLREHENYKRARAKLYLETKAKGEMAIKDIEYTLDNSGDLNKIKDLELQAEIAYRGWRRNREYAKDMMDCAKEQAYMKREEMRSLRDTIKEYYVSKK